MLMFSLKHIYKMAPIPASVDAPSRHRSLTSSADLSQEGAATMRAHKNHSTMGGI